MERRDSKSRTAVAASRGGQADPWIITIHEINKLFHELEGLIEAKKRETENLLKSVTLLGRKKVARRFDISESQLDREVRRDKLDVIVIDRHPRFCLKDLEAYIAARRKKGSCLRRSSKIPPKPSVGKAPAQKKGAAKERPQRKSARRAKRAKRP